jgi:tRNA-binding protein
VEASGGDLRWEEFERVEMRVGRIVEVEEFPEARRPAWKLRVDFGEEAGVLLLAPDPGAALGDRVG